MSTPCNTPFRPSGILLLSILLALSACGGKEGAPPAPAGSPPPPVVTVMTAKLESVPRTTELPGRIASSMLAELRPQVTGIIKSRQFEEGSVVKAGQLLYEIDPASYRAAFDGAKADLARAEAGLYSARLKASRHAELVKINAVSRDANDDAQAALKQAQADIAAAQAALNKARIDLDYTRLVAPISGRIGRSTVTPGALVTANQAESLATVQQLDPIYVDLVQSSADLLTLKHELEAGHLRGVDKNSMPVKLVLEDGREYSQPGVLDFTEDSVNEGTGSVVLRASFPNPQADLLPGMYVRARLVQGIDEKAVLVPHAALIRDDKGMALLLLVNAEGKVEPRPVKAARALGGNWVISEGLSGGEQVIVEGLQKARPGTSVQAETSAPPSASTPPANPQANPQAK